MRMTGCVHFIKTVTTQIMHVIFLSKCTSWEIWAVLKNMEIFIWCVKVKEILLWDINIFCCQMVDTDILLCIMKYTNWQNLNENVHLKVTKLHHICRPSSFIVVPIKNYRSKDLWLVKSLWWKAAFIFSREEPLCCGSRIHHMIMIWLLTKRHKFYSKVTSTRW